jgi:hypothetical protein
MNPLGIEYPRIPRCHRRGILEIYAFQADPCRHIFYDSWLKNHRWSWRRVDLFIRWHLQFTILRRFGIHVNLRPGWCDSPTRR